MGATYFAGRRRKNPGDPAREDAYSGDRQELPNLWRHLRCRRSREDLGDSLETASTAVFCSLVPSSMLTKFLLTAAGMTVALGQSFEVASIKPGLWNGEGSVGVFVRGNTLTAEHVGLNDLVMFAYNLRE